ncbi:MAG: hypothetical protein HYW49_04970 [Deltaproteobacteria bacterium]|nr:hypothetical protein [Deltaproteobacteria bacterium]
MLRKICLLTLAMSLAAIASAYAESGVYAIEETKDSAGLVKFREVGCEAGIKIADFRQEIRDKLSAKEADLIICALTDGKRLYTENGSSELLTEKSTFRVFTQNIRERLIPQCASLAQELLGGSGERCHKVHFLY